MLGTMNTSTRTAPRSITLDAGDSASIEQLTLLPTPSTPARFRLSAETRERGMRHVAEIREMLASRNDRAGVNDTTPRRDQAA
jgi:hypothetical protein